MIEPLSPQSIRKQEHLDLAVSESSQGGGTAGWEDLHLVPRSLPEISLADVDVAASFLGFDLQAPLVIASMTGGHPAALSVNEALATAAEELGVCIGSGSQRAALRDPSLEPTFSILRRAAPTALILANVGACQLVDQPDGPALTRGDVERLVEMVDAELLAVHLNVVEEVVQPEGDEVTAGILAAVERVVGWSPVPVVAKETGAGMDRHTAARLADCGVAAIDVGGAGGTSFARIESARAAARGDELGSRLGQTFGDWGIPTAMAIVEARSSTLPVVATGGVRTGLDVAKAIALGATLAGIGRPALTAAAEGAERVVAEVRAFVHELRVAMLLSGSADLDALARADTVEFGRLKAWREQRS